MLTLRPDILKKASVPLATTWLLGQCMEAKGKQDLWTRQRPEVLAALRERAIVQSAESSNRIEGVTVAAERLLPVVLGKSKPRDRSEEELSGYRQALDWIFSRKNPVALTPKVILHLHMLAQGGFSGDAGQWKQRDNEIIEFLASGERRVRFRPTPAKETPSAVAELCRQYEDSSSDASIPALLTVGTFVFDLLCIHPFRDGNGRVSRLLTTLLLVGHGFQVGRYVSLERLVEETKEEYYRVLAQCSQGWHGGTNPIAPWWNYFLGIVRRGYQELTSAIEGSAKGAAKSELVRGAILAQAGPFSLAEVAAQLPAISSPLIRKVLAEMKRAGQVHLTGHGRGARWSVTPGRPGDH